MIMIKSLLIFVVIVSCSKFFETKKTTSDTDKPATANSEKQKTNNEDSGTDESKKSKEPKEPTNPLLKNPPATPPFRASIFILPPPASETERQEPPTDSDTTTIETSEILATTIGQVFSLIINHDTQSSSNNNKISIKAYHDDTVVEQALVNAKAVATGNNFYDLSFSNSLPVTFYLFFTAKALENTVNRLVILVNDEEISEATIRLSAGNRTLTTLETEEDLVFSFSPLPGGSAVYLRYFKLLAVDSRGQRSRPFDTIRDTARLQDEIEQQQYRLTISDFPCQTGKRIFAWQPENQRGEIIPSIERFYYQTTCP